MVHMDVGILDNGVNQSSIKNGLIFDVIIQDGSIYKKKDDGCEREKYNHGSICAQILDSYSDSIRISSIKVLNKDGKGLVSDLNIAFDWCINKKIKIINLSLGTCNYIDKKDIRSTINHYANKGLIIIAASANNGLCTYPASFANTIAVCSGDVFSVNKQLQIFKGIDFTAPSDHVITIEGVSFRLGKSNSYAAPYVTAMVGNLIREKGLMTVNEVRNELAHHSEQFIYSPDWIEKAWVSPKFHRSTAMFYFEEDKREIQECIDDIDTLVLCSPDEIERYSNAGKNIVYLGSDERIVAPDIKYHFWNGAMRWKQIFFTPCKRDDFNIPVICCIFEEGLDEIYCICKLKNLFANDGYNAYSGCGMIEAPLFDLEYLPVEENVQEKLTDYIYWQTYYQQSDLVLIGTGTKDGYQTLNDNIPDMQIEFAIVDAHVCIDIIIDGIPTASMSYQTFDSDVIREVYKEIISIFDKGKD